MTTPALSVPRRPNPLAPPPGPAAHPPARPDIKVIEINVGKACNNKCAFCMSGLSTTQEMRWVPLPKLQAEVRDYRARGYTGAAFLGGEPTLYPHLLDIVRDCRSLGFTRITLTSNGRRYSEHAFAGALIAAGVTRFNISVHDYRAEVEDALTRVNGNHALKVEGLRYLAQRFAAGDIPDAVSVNCVVNTKNYRNLIPFAEYYAALGVRDIRYNFIRPEGNTGENLELVPRFDTVTAQMRKVIVHNERHLGLHMTFGGVPLCAWPPEIRASPALMARYWGEGKDLYTDVAVYADPRGDTAPERFNWSARKRRYLKDPIPGCETCDHVSVCEGVWKGYLETHGTRGLTPLRGNIPVRPGRKRQRLGHASVPGHAPGAGTETIGYIAAIGSRGTTSNPDARMGNWGIHHVAGAADPGIAAWAQEARGHAIVFAGGAADLAPLREMAPDARFLLHRRPGDSVTGAPEHHEAWLDPMGVSRTAAPERVWAHPPHPGVWHLLWPGFDALFQRYFPATWRLSQSTLRAGHAFAGGARGRLVTPFADGLATSGWKGHIAGPPGEAPLAGELERAATHAPWRDALALHEVPDLEAYVRMMQACAITVVCVDGRDPTAGLHTAAMAQALGRAVIATATAGLCRVITDGASGLLVEHNDPRRWAQALAAVAGDTALRDKLARGGYEAAQRRYLDMLVRLEAWAVPSQGARAAAAQRPTGRARLRMAGAA